MSFQSLRRQTSEPVLSVGGMAWDLSNLCFISHNESSSLPPNRRLGQTRSQGGEKRREQSIYPNKEDLGRCLPADINTSDIFDRSRSPRPRSRGVGHGTGQSLPNGAKEFDQLNLPSVYDRYSQPLLGDPAARDADEFSGSYYEPQDRDYSRWGHGSSHYEVPPDPPPIPEYISDYSSDVSSQSYMLSSVESRGRKPVQVEVYPGEFLQLRGADETIEAIERGHTQLVCCYACGLGLSCIADCKLVICPDCRIISPVPRRRQPVSLLEDHAECEDEEDNFYTYRGSLPQVTPLWRDDDESFHTSKQKSNVCSRNGSSGVESSGGIGLGLSIEKYLLD
jgi:hypothetical protein